MQKAVPKPTFTAPMDEQNLIRLSRLSRQLITDLEPLFALQCVGQEFPESQAVQLINDAFSEAAAVLNTLPTDE